MTPGRARSATLVVAILSVVGMTLSSAIVAYAFSRIQWRGRGTMFTLMLATAQWLHKRQLFLKV